MASLNVLSVSGNLGRDPETRVLQNGKGVTSFSLAVSDRKKAGDKYEDVTIWLDCEAWDRTGEVISQYCRKGSYLVLSGKLRQDEWNDKDTGQKRTKLKMVVLDAVLPPKGGAAQSGNSAPAEREERPKAPLRASAGAEEDVPF